MKRRIFSVLLSSALLLTALAGCGQGGEAAPSGSSSDADSETGTRDELIFVNYRDIRDLNPHLYAGEMYAQSILYDTLVSNTEDGYVGCLAEDWTISDDGRIYTFNIRDGVTFSDGTPCDANAILANFNAILENRERHTWLEMMNLLVGVSAPATTTTRHPTAPACISRAPGRSQSSVHRLMRNSRPGPGFRSGSKSTTSGSKPTATSLSR